MKRLIFITMLCLLSQICLAQEEINSILDSLKIVPTTISFHPKGDILISTAYNSSDKSQYMLLINKPDGSVNIDTLSTSRPNRSAFSSDGEYLIHNFQDEVSGEFYTVKRKYDGPQNIGAPYYLSERLFVDNMYYYFMDDHQDFYYYTYNRENRSNGGLLYAKFENGEYQKPQMIYPDRENAVAYSPLLLDDKTMIFAQHGVSDDTFEGIHFSLKNKEGKWSDPVMLEFIPMSNVITSYDKNTIAFLVAKTGRLRFYDKSKIMFMINQNKKLTETKDQ
ncbi:MAG: hypothetical protein GVY20_01215 [Bacteroidetes bacterium]|nr:hypothetical protein [Bacteroidota bacterium]